MAETIHIPLDTAEALVELAIHGRTHEGYTPVHTEQIDARRWVSVHQLIVRREDDGTLWRLIYEQGLTEDQDAELFGGDDPVEARRVIAREVTTVEYVDAEETR